MIRAVMEPRIPPKVEIVVEPSPYNTTLPVPTAHVHGLSERMGTALAHKIAAAFLASMEHTAETSSLWSAYPEVRRCAVTVKTPGGTRELTECVVVALRDAAKLMGATVTIEWRMPATATDVEG